MAHAYALRLEDPMTLARICVFRQVTHVEEPRRPIESLTMISLFDWPSFSLCVFDCAFCSGILTRPHDTRGTEKARECLLCSVLSVSL